MGARIRGRIRGLDLDQTFDIKKNRPVKVVGVFEADGSAYESEVWVDRELLRQAYGRQGVVSSVRVRLDSPTQVRRVPRRRRERQAARPAGAARDGVLREAVRGGVASSSARWGRSCRSSSRSGAMIGAMITMYAAVANRQREIGTLRALGFSRPSILVSFLLEAVLLALVGGAVGAAASMAMGFVHFSMVNMASWSEIVFSFDPTPEVIVDRSGVRVRDGPPRRPLPGVRAARTSPLKAIRG